MKENTIKILCKVNLHLILNKFDEVIKYNQILLTIVPVLCKLKLVIVWL